MPLKNWTDAVTALFWRNWITILGASIATATAFPMLGIIALGLAGETESAYTGILAFMVLPGVFVFGLILIPIGALWERRKRNRGHVKESETSRAGRLPSLDFNQPRTRRAALIVIFLTSVNLFLISAATYQGVVFMDSVQFCGLVCHQVMEPEFTAYTGSPHSRVKCVECHIGPGAPWFVRSKLSGVGQVFAVALRTYPQPIPAPVENLRPSQDTCEQCHWPQKFTGDRVRITTEYADDEENTKTQSVLLMHIGGGGRDIHGIHSWHIDPRKETTYYASDEKRQVIPYVRVTHLDGTVHEYTAEDAEIDPEAIPAEEMRRMDCIDCHNRPTHIFYLTGDAVNTAMAGGAIDPAVPYIKEASVAVLEASGADAGYDADLAEKMEQFYQENHPEVLAEHGEKIKQAVAALEAIRSENVFPHMNVTWGTYPNNIGHESFPGCFRCHDESHADGEGNVISQDCNLCHTVLAWDEEDPAILEELGLAE